MKLSQRGEYALRALIVLGLNKDAEVVRVQMIAQQQNIPRRFLELILNDLKTAGFLESRRGTAGGYRLRRPPEEITLAEVVRQIEGPLAPVSCVSAMAYEKCSCPDESKCGIRSIMKEVRDAIVRVLEGVTLAQLCERVRQLERKEESALDYII